MKPPFGFRCNAYAHYLHPALVGLNTPSDHPPNFATFQYSLGWIEHHFYSFQVVICSPNNASNRLQTILPINHADKYPNPIHGTLSHAWLIMRKPLVPSDCRHSSTSAAGRYCVSSRSISTQSRLTEVVCLIADLTWVLCFLQQVSCFDSPYLEHGRG